MEKLDRARIILGAIKSMLQTNNLPSQRKYSAGDMQDVKVDGKWNATITRGSGPEEEFDCSRPWDMLHLTANGKLRLALKFRELDVQIIVFDPGTWERWFGTYDFLDSRPVGPPDFKFD